jgi:hypothetical protein
LTRLSVLGAFNLYLDVPFLALVVPTSFLYRRVEPNMFEEAPLLGDFEEVGVDLFLVGKLSCPVK